MGTRSAAKIKLRAALFKCDVCGRRLMSAEALKTHQECVHNAPAKVKTKTPIKPAVTKPKPLVPKIKNVKLGKIAIEKPKTATLKKGTVTPKPAAKTKSPPKTITTSTPNSIDGISVQYECPQCMKIFPTYFSAYRHIQKHHCVNSAGDKVLPNSPDLIKPRKMEPPWYYICSGCKQQFNSLKLFDLHVAGLHYKGVESMFFPSKEEFQEWKDEMETLTKVRYSILGQYSFKEMYRCTVLPDGGSAYGDTTSLVCPSTIVVQEFSKGVQVHFYKDHHAHKHQEYVLNNKYKKFSLTTLLQNAEGYTQIDEVMKVDENDLYLQFKKLMECIVLDAAKINIKTLKVLIGKALDMTSVLNSYEEDPDSDTAPTLKDNDHQTWVVGLDQNAAEKRKVDASEDKSKTEPITKRFKTRMYQHKPPENVEGNASCPVSLLQDSTIKIINSFSLADKDISKVVNEVDSESDNQSKSSKEDGKSTFPIQDENDKNELMTPIKVKKKSSANSPSSFNDSYKDFVSKSFKITPAPKSKSKSKSNTGSAKSPQTKPISPKPQNNSKPQNVSKTEAKSPPLPAVKPKPPETVKEKTSESIPRHVDLKYEVKERENDCNILILKI